MKLELIGDKNIVSVPRHDRLLVDMVNEGIEEDSNTISDKNLNITCDEDLTTTCGGLILCWGGGQPSEVGWRGAEVDFILSRLRMSLC